MAGAAINLSTRHASGRSPGTDTEGSTTNRVAHAERDYLILLDESIGKIQEKLDRIKQTEGLRVAGKSLNSEQLGLVKGKSLIELALSDHQGIRGLVERKIREIEHCDVDEQQESHGAAPSSSSNPSSPPSVPNNVSGKSQNASTESRLRPETSSRKSKTKDLSEKAQGRNLLVSSSRGSCRGTESTRTKSVEVQTDVSGLSHHKGLDNREVAGVVAAARATAAEEKHAAVLKAEAKGLIAGRAEAKAGVARLVRLLQVATYLEAGGQPLPAALEHVLQVILGKGDSKDDDFDRRCRRGSKYAMLYVDPRGTRHEVAPGLNPLGLERLVSQLRQQIIDFPIGAGEPGYSKPDSSPKFTVGGKHNPQNQHLHQQNVDESEVSPGSSPVVGLSPPKFWSEDVTEGKATAQPAAVAEVRGSRMVLRRGLCLVPDPSLEAAKAHSNGPYSTDTSLHLQPPSPPSEVLSDCESRWGGGSSAPSPDIPKSAEFPRKEEIRSPLWAPSPARRGSESLRQDRLPKGNRSSGEPAASITQPSQKFTECSVSPPKSPPLEKRAMRGSRQSWYPRETREVIEDQCVGIEDQTEKEGQLRGRGPAQGSSLVIGEETGDPTQHRGRDVKEDQAFKPDYHEGLSNIESERLPAVDVETWGDTPRSCTGSNVSVPNALSVESDSRHRGQGGETESVRHHRASRGKASEKKRATARRRKGEA